MLPVAVLQLESATSARPSVATLRPLGLLGLEYSVPRLTWPLACTRYVDSVSGSALTLAKRAKGAVPLTHDQQPVPGAPLVPEEAPPGLRGVPEHPVRGRPASCHALRHCP